MRKLALILAMSVILVSCKAKMNQYIKNENNVKKRSGKWKEEYSSNEGTYIAVGKYKNGEKVGVWKTFFDNKLYQKDKIRKNITKTKRYFSDGTLMESGQSKMDISTNERHWYYFDDWKYYNDQGKLLYIKKYHLGNKTDSISLVK
ncbi:putative ATP-binding protein involved in virulence [Chryseobacterium defluvii]|uniref:Putative ATP-binding protein involved in virulence n=1 Tax=Chryseobacterium defluvii TaxID=160396 RepID=A0A840KAN0_9FLAO|nr:hypothetical protein [Chryseobacterium defluvii]MBB4805057.1 putative ATP-binding protein involved in virulence [Chryseobacterium defluvii]